MIRTRVSVPDFELVGDGTETTVEIPLTQFPFALQLDTMLPDAVTALRVDTSDNIPATLDGSVVTLTFPSALGVDEVVSIRMMLEFNL